MTNDYHPDQKQTSPRDVIVAWILAIAVIAGVALFAPNASVDLGEQTREITAMFRS